MTEPALLDVRQMLDRLIGFDTSRNSNLALIEFVRDYLDGSASPPSWCSTPPARRPICSPASALPRAAGLLSGHTDVVPVDGQVWSSDAFACVARADRLYGAAPPT